MSSAHAPHFWEYFSRHQRQACRKPSGPDAWALDDSLHEILNRAEDGLLPGELQSQFQSRCRNRRQTHIHRSRLLRDKYAPRQSCDERCDPAQRLIQREKLKWVRRNTTDSEWCLLRELATGKTYSDLSVELSEAVSTLKSRAARCRSRLKEQLAAEEKRSCNC